jgi:hypothetical protein
MFSKNLLLNYRELNFLSTSISASEENNLVEAELEDEEGFLSFSVVAFLMVSGTCSHTVRGDPKYLFK